MTEADQPSGRVDVRCIDPTNRSDREAFIALPFRLYRALPRWVPPVIVDQRRELDPRRNPFFEHSDAAMFLAERGGDPVGRVLAMEHRPFNEHTGNDAVLFDLFESDDDAEVAEALLDAVEAWGRGRGLRRISGPRRFLAGTPAGLLVDGFDRDPAVGVAYTAPWYPALIEGAGFAKETDLVSGYVPAPSSVPSPLAELAARIRSEQGFSIRRYSSRLALWRDRLTIAHLYNETFAANDEFCPLSGAELDLLARRFALVAEPDLVAYVQHGPDVAGFVVLVPEIGAAIRASGGRVLPFGWWRMLRGARTTTRAAIHLGGVVGAYRGTGANVVGMAEFVRWAAGARYEEFGLELVDERNTRMLRNLSLLGEPRWTKLHRIYTKGIEGRPRRRPQPHASRRVSDSSDPLPNETTP